MGRFRGDWITPLGGATCLMDSRRLEVNGEGSENSQNAPLSPRCQGVLGALEESAESAVDAKAPASPHPATGLPNATLSSLLPESQSYCWL